MTTSVGRACAATIALGILAASSSSCSHDATPARGPSPTFESEVPPTELNSLERAARLNNRPPTSDPAVVSEADTCSRLRDAAVSATDVPGGIVIELRPTERAPKSSLQEGAGMLLSALGPPARLRTAVGSGRGCDLRDLAAHGPRVQLEHDDDAIRVHLTTRDPDDVARLRRDARRFTKALGPSSLVEPPI